MSTFPIAFALAYISQYPTPCAPKSVAIVTMRVTIVPFENNVPIARLVVATVPSRTTHVSASFVVAAVVAPRPPPLLKTSSLPLPDDDDDDDDGDDDDDDGCKLHAHVAHASNPRMPIGTDKNAVAGARNAMEDAERNALRHTTGFIADFHSLTADTMILRSSSSSNASSSESSSKSSFSKAGTTRDAKKAFLGAMSLVLLDDDDDDDHA